LGYLLHVRRSLRMRTTRSCFANSSVSNDVLAGDSGGRGRGTGALARASCQTGSEAGRPQPRPRASRRRGSLRASRPWPHRTALGPRRSAKTTTMTRLPIGYSAEPRPLPNSLRPSPSCRREPDGAALALRCSSKQISRTTARDELSVFIARELERSGLGGAVSPGPLAHALVGVLGRAATPGFDAHLSSIDSARRFSELEFTLPLALHRDGSGQEVPLAHPRAARASSRRGAEPGRAGRLRR